MIDSIKGAKKRRRRLERRWKASNAEPDRLAYRAACSTTNKLITHSRAASNLKCINDASSHPKRLWGTIKSLLHPSPQSEQLSPSASQPLANSLASFFLQKILTIKNSISSKLHGSPSLLILINPIRTNCFPISLLSHQQKSLSYSTQCQTNHHHLIMFPRHF